jgi:hypothetical protein
MNADKKKAPSPVSSADRKSNAGMTPDPWEVCASYAYGADRSFLWSVREQVIDTPPEERAQVEEKLLKSLARPDTTDAGRAFLCQMLAMVGGAKSVPTLAGLLRNATTTEEARYALQAIPGPEASAALRDALGSLSGKAKAGLIGSLSTRREGAARAALTAIQGNSAEPALVREAAARALEHLATAKA